MATVIPVGPAGKRENECRIEVRLKNGELLGEQNYSSADHEHGYGVVQAQWTPDSQFFVVILDNSGGHSPMQTPVAFYSCKRLRFFVLDHLLKDSVGFAHLEITAPDRITVTLVSGKLWSGSLTELIKIAK